MKPPVPSLTTRVYARLNEVPPGKLTTYRDLAHSVQSKAYRGVGQILSKNPNAPAVPCHRVVRSDGKLGGYRFGVPQKVALLQQEGITIDGDKVSNLPLFLHTF